MYSQKDLGKIIRSYKHSIAIEENGNYVSYSELLERSDKVLTFLIENGFGHKSRIGICVSNVTDMVVCMIGVIRARCIFVPLDPSLPDKRFSLIAEKSDLESTIIVSDDENIQKKLGPVRSVKLSDILKQPTPDERFIFPEYQEDDDLYIYFTSGSTGEPKGIIGKNSSLWHFLKWEIETYKIQPGKRFSQLISPYFDAFLRDVFIPLISGGTICVAPRREGLFNPEELIQWIDKQGINFIHCVPSVFRIFNHKGITAQSYQKLENVLLSGERIIPAELTNWYHVFGDRVQLVNLYGSTEATMISSYYNIQSTDSSKVKIPIGQPISDVELMIMDKDQKPCRPLIAGELYIVSNYLSNGYLDNAKQTANKFIHLYDNNRQRIAFRTGDSARRLADGSIDLLGREDRLIKLRGIRIELDEIERVLRKCEVVENAVVLHDKKTDSLIAFVTADANEGKPEGFSLLVEKYLAEHLPAYMIPSRINIMDEIPLLSNGKVNYNLLIENSGKTNETLLPANEIEERIFILWKDILETGQISTDQNFMAAGGNSLNIMRLMSRVFVEFNVRVSLAELFMNLTIQKQAVLLSAKLDDLKVLETALETFSGDKAVPAHQISKAQVLPYYAPSSAQRRMYFLYELDRASLAYNMPYVAELEGVLDVERLNEAFRSLIARHESLRTTFEVVQGEVLQRINETADFTISHYEAEDAETTAAVITSFIRPFDLSTGPLLRIGLVKVSQDNHLLLADMHHIITDGVSQGILIRDFMELYEKGNLPVLSLQYKDYSEWQQSQTQQEQLSSQRNYWKEKFSGELSVLDLPLDHSRPSVKSYQGSSRTFTLNREETHQLKALGEGSDATLFMTLLSVLNVLLGKLSNQEDITIGTPIAGRYHEELEGIIGLFVNTLALRNQPKGGLSFLEFLEEVKMSSLSGFEHQLYPYEELVNELELPRDTGRNPLFDVMFTFQNFRQDELQIPGLQLKFRDADPGISKFDLTVIAVEAGVELQLIFEYSTALFKAETIDRFISYFKRIITAVTADADKQLSQIDILSSSERNKLLNEFNATAVDYPRDKTIIDLFEQQVERTPDNVAVVYGSHTLTYKELNEKADQLAAYLQQAEGVKTGDKVGLLLEREEELFPSIFGILKAGGVYVPLSVNYPSARLNTIISDAGLKVLITRTRYIEALSPEMGTGLLNLDTSGEKIQASSRALQGGSGPADLAYIIYTSGSTGQPKGVMIEHGSVVNRLLWMQEEYPLSSKDVLLQKTSLVFDVSVWELFWWSFTGASVCVPAPETEKDPAKLIDEIARNGVTTIHFVPSMLSVFLDAAARDKTGRLNTLRQVFASGEALGAEQVNRFAGILYGTSGTRLINLYGPTEATVDVTWYECDLSIKNEMIPIGKPIANTQMYILDKNAALSPLGVAGELCISGDGLSRGYLNKPELTAERFIDHPYKAGEKLYRTGDLARWLPDGNIAYLGRIDNQVKIRGYRIELGEIESQLLSYENIKEAIVTCFGDIENRKLAAFLVPQDNVILNMFEVKKFLKTKLPEYMIPAQMLEIDKIPLTNNGKADIKELVKSIDKFQVEKTSFLRPRTEIEIKVAKIWNDILNIGEIDLDDNFFDLGGHSILLIRVNSIVSDEYGVELPFNLYFGNSLEQISREIELKSKEPQLQKIESEI
jgi:amino acid adenylation domain-containing protein